MTCFIGVDLHKTQFTVHTRTENRVESMDQIIQYPVTNEGYANFLKRIRNLKTRGYEVKIGVEINFLRILKSLARLYTPITI